MNQPRPVDSGEIHVENIGQPREADILFSRIMRKLSQLALDGELVLSDAVLPERQGPEASIENVEWTSPEFIEGTDTPHLKIRQRNEPDIVGQWAIKLEAERHNNSPTVDHFEVNGAQLTVEKHALNGEASDHYAGIIEVGIVYNPARDVADMVRLRALTAALETIEL